MFGKKKAECVGVVLDGHIFSPEDLARAILELCRGSQSKAADAVLLATGRGHLIKWNENQKNKEEENLQEVIKRLEEENKELKMKIWYGKPKYKIRPSADGTFDLLSKDGCSGKGGFCINIGGEPAYLPIAEGLASVREAMERIEHIEQDVVEVAR